MATKSVILVVLAAAAWVAQAQEEYDVVETSNGALRGLVVEGGSRSFRGIPFGQAPVGNLRFASPVPTAPWSPEVRDALEPSAICPGSRVQSVIGIVPRIDVAEDCLYLNVFTPSRERLTRPLPVLFCDGWELGAYDGNYVVQTRDVIIVTHNYRLGPFGFLVSPDGQGNYGLEDQRLALQWVIDHIANFGGDPNQITIYGESAGAMSVAAHIISPPSRGMFQRGIMQSDPFTISTKTRELSLETGAAFAANLNCTFDLACLRTRTMREISSNGNVGMAGKDAIIADLLTWGPTIDGFNLDMRPVDGFQEPGVPMDIPIIIGTNGDEVVLFQDIVDVVLRVASIFAGRDLSITMNEDEYRRLIDVIFKEKAAQVIAQYPPLPNNASNYDNFVALGTLYMFECSTRQAALGFVNVTGNSVYAYKFTHAPDFVPLLGRLFGGCFGEAACHALELPFTWHMESLALIDLAARFTAAEEIMSQAMIDYWTGFASGNINDGAAITWPLLTQAQQGVIVLDTPITLGGWDTAACEFWDSIGYTY